MIKIVVSSSDIKELKGIAKGTGNPYHMRIQTAYAFTVNPDTGAVAEFPDKFEVSLEKEQAPYAKGTYQLSPSAVFVSREGRIDIRPRLIPVAATKSA